MDARGGRRRRLLAAYHRNRFAWLFVSLLLTLGAGPTLEALVPDENPLLVLLGINLVAAIASVAREYRMRLPLALGVTFIVARVLVAFLGGPAILAVGDLAWLTMIVLTTVAAVGHALGRGVVDRERVLAALDAYLLAGLVFGVVYWQIDRLRPGALVHSGFSELDLSSAIYFSFVTIATLGYGDVLPVGPLARGLAVVECVSGQMYLTVLVARLVSLYARQQD